MRGAPGAEGLARPLFATTFLIATCGLVYELVAGAMASYLLGDSVTWFSLVIGTYLSAMGFGAWLSRFIERGLLARFVEVELAVALVGGFLALILFGAFAYTAVFRPLLFVMVGLVGTLVGVELPLLIRILEQQTTLKELVARVFFLDYIGAFAASLLFPAVLLPHLGLLRTSLALGLVNALVGLWSTFLFEAPAPVLRRLRVMGAMVVLALLAGLLSARRVEAVIEQDLFADPVVLREVTPYQRLTLTSRDADTRLYINGALQFSSVDEYRYHEALVHPALRRVQARRVLVMGGGDGLAVREILRHASVEEVVLVDLDPAMTRLFREHDRLASLNGGALRDPRVTVINEDAFTWLQGDTGEEFDAAIVDFPDPNHLALGKLYTTHFYRLLARALTEDGVVALQATSPLWSRQSFWCIVHTIESEGFRVRPYHALVPSFGEWGFILAFPGREGVARPLPSGLSFLDEVTEASLFHFPPDMDRVDAPVNRLDDQVLVSLYTQGWEMGGRAWK